jgi:hypothetical protein
MLAINTSALGGIVFHPEVIGVFGVIKCPKPQPKTTIMSSGFPSSHNEDFLALPGTSLGLLSCQVVKVPPL